MIEIVAAVVDTGQMIEYCYGVMKMEFLFNYPS